MARRQLLKWCRKCQPSGDILKAKKYWILVIVSFSILIVLWPAQQITGETDLSAKEKEAKYYTNRPADFG